MATVLQVVEKAYTKVNGEYEAITESSDDFKTYLAVLNIVMANWFDTPYTKWQSTFNPAYLLPTPVQANVYEYVVADADKVHMAATPFDNVMFVNGTVIGKKFKMTDQALFQSSNVADICALLGGVLHLKTIPEDIIGSSIKLPVYVAPTAYTAGSQTIKIDSVSWLVAAMAAFICDASPVPFIARNADKFSKEAAIFMKAMQANNRHRQHLTIKRAGQNVDDQNFANLSQAINAGVGVGGGTYGDIDGGTF